VTRSYLLVLADRDAIAWVLREQRMAFPATPRAEVSALAVNDRLFLYTTRGAWNNPSRHRGRVIGTARVQTAVQTLDRPVQIGGRNFWSECELAIDGVAPYPGGIELQPLASQLDAFPKPDAWSVYLRRPLLALSDADAALLDAQLNPLLTALDSVLPGYLARSPAAAS
jgi:hypothetical protein